jgi:hypothetical protein
MLYYYKLILFNFIELLDMLCVIKEFLKKIVLLSIKIV